jgi:hypothetical protein
VARRNRQSLQTREMHITFEPSRLSPSWVAQAYEQIVPIVRRTPSRLPSPGRECLESVKPAQRDGSLPLESRSKEWLYCSYEQYSHQKMSLGS